MLSFERSFQVLGTTLKLWADCVNHLPYFTPPDNIQHFKTLHESYRTLHTGYESKTKPLLELLQDCCRSCTIADVQLKSLFQTLIVQLKPGVCMVEGVALKERFNLFLKAYEAFYRFSLSNASLPHEFLVQKETLEKQFATILGILHGFQGALIKSTSLKHLSSEGEIAKHLGTHFDSAKTLQHQLYALKQSALDFSCIDNPSKTGLTAHGFLLKEAYEELVFLSALVSPEYVCEALRDKIHILASNRDELLRTLHQLQHPRLSKIVRLMRIIQVYQSWSQALESSVSTLNATDLATVLAIQQLLSYDKKTFFKTGFQSQRVAPILQAIRDTLSDLKLEAPKGLDKVYLELLRRKQQVQEALLRRESQIKASQSYSQALLATAILGIKQQPEYQLGQLSATLNAQLLDQFPHLPILGERLPPALLHQLQQAVGLSFLGITLYTSNYFGYSYQLIACLNRILFAQINLLIQAGGYADTLLQATLEPLVESLKKRAPTGLASTLAKLPESLRLDELGLLEKERGLQWLSGLGVHLGLNQGGLPPACMGYIAGTTLGETASYWVEQTARVYDCDEHAILALKALTHVMTYSYAYRLAYESTLAYCAQSASLMSQQQAFEILGLGQYAKFQEVNKRYRELAFRYHPDKCKVDCEEASAKMAELNTAYGVLKKKLV